MLFWSAISCAHAPGYCLTFISFAFFDLSNRRFSKKNWSLPAVLFWQISVNIYICLSISFFLSSFDHRAFDEVSTVALVLICVILELKLNQKWIYYLTYTNVANENCVEFCMKEVFKCRERRMMRWEEGWTKAQAWGCQCHPKIYPRSTSVKSWGCPRQPLLHQQKYQVIFQDTIFLLLHMLCVFRGASLFLFSVLFCFVFYNKWLDHAMFVLERDTLRFHCLEHSSFHFYRSTIVLFF
jgi:hypothetical protein